MFQDIDPDILEAVNLVENEYQDFFKEKLKEYGVESPNELGYEKAQEFFNDIKKNWKGTNESEEIEESDEEELNEGVDDVYAETYSHLIDPSTIGVGDIVSFPYSGNSTEFKVELIVNPACFGMPTIYHLKALNGPCEGQEFAFDEEFVQNSLKEENEKEDEDELLDRVVEAIENEEEFESEEIEESDEEVEIEESEESEEIEESDEEELNESTDFDISKINDKKLESVLKIFLKSKATDGEDYEIASKGNKLMLKVHNNKFVPSVQKELKGE